MGRTFIVIGALAGALFAGVSPAHAASYSVSANANNTFTPSQLSITEGDSVTFSNAGGAHNVHFEEDVDAAFPPQQDAWSFTRTFSAPGTYRYFDDAHGGRGGLDMAGVIVVNRKPEPARTVKPSRPTPPPRHFAAVTLRDAFSGSAFRMRIAAPKSGIVEGGIHRRNRNGKFVKIGTVLIRVPAGLSSVRISRTAEGKKLNFGTYRVRLVLHGENDKLRFKLRS